MSIKTASTILRSKLKALRRRYDLKEFSISVIDAYGQEKHYRSLEPEDFVDYMHVLTSGAPHGIVKSIDDIQFVSITYTLN